MKKLKVINGKVELHGKVFDVYEEFGKYFAIHYFAIDGEIIYAAFQFSVESRDSGSYGKLALLVRSFGEGLCVGKVCGSNLEQNKSELYELDFGSA